MKRFLALGTCLAALLIVSCDTPTGSDTTQDSENGTPDTTTPDTATPDTPAVPALPTGSVVAEINNRIFSLSGLSIVNGTGSNDSISRSIPVTVNSGSDSKLTVAASATLFGKPSKDASGEILGYYLSLLIDVSNNSSDDLKYVKYSYLGLFDASDVKLYGGSYSIGNYISGQNGKLNTWTVTHSLKAGASGRIFLFNKILDKAEFEAINYVAVTMGSTPNDDPTDAAYISEHSGIIKPTGYSYGDADGTVYCSLNYENVGSAASILKNLNQTCIFYDGSDITEITTLSNVGGSNSTLQVGDSATSRVSSYWMGDLSADRVEVLYEYYDAP